MKLPMRGVVVHVSGTGIQGAGRIVRIQPLSPDEPSKQVALDMWLSGLIPLLIVCISGVTAQTETGQVYYVILICIQLKCTISQ